MAGTDNSRLKKIGEQIRALRQQRNWTIEALALEANLSIPQISEIERGLRDAQITTYEKIADAFGVSLAGLFPSDFNDEKMEEELIEIHKIIKDMDSDKKTKLLEHFKGLVFLTLDSR